jgi:hypothetical protein
MKSFSEIMGEANDISCLIKLSQRFINEGKKIMMEEDC